MFCTTLRRRSSTAALIPILISASSPTFLGKHRPLNNGVRIFIDKTAESLLETHDLSIPLPTKPPRALRLLLLTPSSTVQESMSATLSRIDHLTHLTGGQGIAVIFLLSPKPSATGPSSHSRSHAIPTFVSAKTLPLREASSKNEDGFQAYTALQATLLAHPGSSSIPILPLVDSEKLLDLLKECQKRFSQPQAPAPQLPVTSHELLRESVSGCAVPSQGQTDRDDGAQVDVASVINHVFGNLQEFVQWCVSSLDAEGTRVDSDGYGDVQMVNGEEDPGKLLRDIVGDEQAAEVKAWWQEEWIAD
jgi:hypothetical protein